jgi:hypothetical protein
VINVAMLLPQNTLPLRQAPFREIAYDYLHAAVNTDAAIGGMKATNISTSSFGSGNNARARAGTRQISAIIGAGYGAARPGTSCIAANILATAFMASTFPTMNSTAI